jgi:HK97 family phage major capsid protein
MLRENDSFQGYKDHRRSFGIEVNPQVLKKDILVADDFTGDVIVPDRVTNEVFSSPHNITRVRDIIGVGTTTSDTISFVRSTSTRNADTVAEGAAKGQSEEAFTEVTEPVQVIAHYFRVSNQALADFSQLATYLQVEGVAGLKDVEDTQILNGTGVSPDLSGIITDAGTTYAGGTDNTDDTDIDVLVKAYWQLMGLKYMPSFIIVPPAKMKDIQLTKATDGNYIYPNFAPVGLNDWAINGVPLYVHHAMPADTFLIGDSRKALVWDREQVNVKMSESDATNFTTNKTTIRIEERLAVATYDTAAFISATFTDAKDSLT